jgi:hypothetical protein
MIRPQYIRKPMRGPLPKFLESLLKKEYPNNARAVYGTMNRIGAMHGSKETPKGKRMQVKHDRDRGKKQTIAGMMQ